MDVFGIDTKIASMPLLQKQEKNSGKVNLTLIKKEIKKYFHLFILSLIETVLTYLSYKGLE